MGNKEKGEEDMKKWKRALAGALCLLMVETPAFLSQPSSVVYAAEETASSVNNVKNGLVKEKGKYYFYVDGVKKTGWRNVTSTVKGKKVTNRYYFGKNGAAYAASDSQGTLVKKIKGKYYGFDKKGRMITNKFRSVKKKKGKKTVTYRYYFGKNGAAYTGKKVNGVKEIAVKKIGSKSYGFDVYGRMVKGIWVKGVKIYSFDTKNGVYSSSKSKKLNHAAEYLKDAAEIRRLLGTPKKTEQVEGCFLAPSEGSEYLLYYDNFALDIVRYKATGKEVVVGPMAL